ncbi:MAG: ABC transporter permease [Xanthomonadales bacterium]|nr:ABC transporter permease [Gammaproteobacteria bacterium]MBT8057590.1 ABC transporter permease [Gammaproteobacteria bacterium]NNL05121.1 ABC transporter permease [Xanthomonadales bacterium]
MDWRHFGYMLYQATRASYLAQEKNSSLGLIWHLLNPLLMTAVLFLVFRRAQFLQGIEHYPLFILIGLIHYNFFINSTSRSAQNFLTSRPLILNTTVPLELLVLRQTSIEGLTLLVEVMLVLLLGVMMGVTFTATLWLYPVILVGILALSLGSSLFLCSLVVFLSDLNYVWGVFCRLLFFLTPVFFSAEIAGDGLARWVLELNPLTRLIHISREALLYGGQVPVGEVGLALLGPALVLLLGLVVFRASRAKIPDYI